MASTRIDNFIHVYSLSGSLDPWFITDAWVAQGGRYITIEFSRDGTISATDDWSINEPLIEFTSTSTDFFGTIIDVHHELRMLDGEPYSVVILKVQTPRVIARAETIQIKRGASAITTNGDESIVYMPTTPDEVTIRNFSNVIADGSSSLPLRSGNNQDNLSSVDSTTVSIENFNISSGSFGNGTLSGQSLNIVTQRGSLTEDSTDSEFNNEIAWEMSGSYIGKMVYDGSDYSSPDISGDEWSWMFALNVDSGAKFFVSKVSETVMGGGRTEFDGPIIIPASRFSLVNQDTTVEYAFSDVVQVNAAAKSLVVNFGTPQTIYLGDLASRNIVLLLRYDGTNMHVNMMNGNQIRRLSSYNVSFPSISTDEYYSIRCEGSDENTVKIHEFQEFNRFITDIEAQEYASFLDDKIQTSARDVYVDLDSGDDSNDGLTTITPKLTIAAGLERVLATAGDHVRIKTGTSTTLSEKIEIFDIAEEGTPSLGYSPDYPFVLGYYESRSNGRPDINFDGDVDSFIDINGRSDNVCIEGLYLHSNEREYSHGSFVGVSTMNGYTDGYGIIYDVSHLNDNIPTGLYVNDCHVSNVLRSGVAIREGSSSNQRNATKFNAIVKTQFSDMYNAKYAKENQNHEIDSDNYGVSGVYVEGVTGVILDNNLFYRVGWLPDVPDLIPSLTGAIFDSTLGQLVSASLAPYLSSFSAWSDASSTDLDFQRINITEIEGGAVDLMNVMVAGDIELNGSSIGLPIKNFAGTLSSGDDVDFTVMDAFPRCAGNADIVIMGLRTTSGQSGNVQRDVNGSVLVSNCISIESSGYQILSDASYASFQSIVVDSPYGAHMSQDYTRLAYGYYGSSYGSDIIRKTSNGDSENLFIGDMEIIDKSVNHGWSIKSPANKPILKTIIERNIFAYTGASGMDGTSTYSDEAVTSSIYFDINASNSMNVFIDRNTFYNGPMSCINMYASSISGVDMRVRRNIIDQKLDQDPSSDLFYSFVDPYTGVVGSWAALTFGGASNRNIYNQEDAASSPETQDRVRINSILDLTFNQWKSGTSDVGTWADVQYATEGRSLNSYNADILSGPESTIHFATSAIAGHADGWDSTFSAEDILAYIRAGFTPTNIDPVDYNNSPVGAVDFTSPILGSSFGVEYANNSTYHGYGKGF